jgi:hypothetical protein
MRLYEAGLLGCPREPGLLLADVLKRTGGVYETTIQLSPIVRDEIREIAELISDQDLLALAEQTEVPVTLEHLRHLDPQTRIITRLEIHYEGDEGALLSRTRKRRQGVATIMPDGTVRPIPPAASR